MFATRTRLIASSVREVPKFLRIKTSTDLAGIEVHPNPLPALESKYTRTLEVLKALPESAVYRQSAQAATQSRLDIVREAMTERSQTDPALNEHAIKTVQTKIDSGIVEELLEQANCELDLAAKMIDWKPYVETALQMDMLTQIRATRGPCPARTVEAVLDARSCWRRRPITCCLVGMCFFLVHVWFRTPCGRHCKEKVLIRLGLRSLWCVFLPYACVTLAGLVAGPCRIRRPRLGACSAFHISQFL